MIAATAPLSEYQQFNRKLYEIVDDRNYGTLDLHSYLLRHVTHILKAVRKGKYDTIGYHLSMCLSWTFAVANRLHIDVADEMWRRFPGVCPYCTTAPCSCSERAAQRAAVQPACTMPITITDWQNMFANIYRDNTILHSAMHLAEEAGELSEALRNYLATHRDVWFHRAVEELIDVIANLFGIATTLTFDLGVSSARYFEHGCPKCTSAPCACGYVSIDDPI